MKGTTGPGKVADGTSVVIQPESAAVLPADRHELLQSSCAKAVRPQEQEPAAQPGE